MNRKQRRQALVMSVSDARAAGYDVPGAPAPKRPRPAAAEAEPVAPVELGAASIDAKRNALLEVADAHRQMRLHDERRDAAVAKAREAGASWNEIARATDMTPQGSHKRWRT